MDMEEATAVLSGEVGQAGSGGIAQDPEAKKKYEEGTMLSAKRASAGEG
jgi:hypothetical protein